ncbi:imidazole glycerol phosphate synthase subunit HisH [soil metagenome]
MGNLRSVQKALQFVGAECQITDQLDQVEKLVIPGVGAFGAAMEKIGPHKERLTELALEGVPILGICLGQQLLFDGSEEHGWQTGLGLIPGKVIYLPRDLGLKVPHIGWSPISVTQRFGPLQDVVDGDQVYFVHSLHCVCDDPGDIAATAQYGIEFAAAVHRNSIWGMQYHPEKSSKVGLQMLRRFADC